MLLQLLETVSIVIALLIGVYKLKAMPFPYKLILWSVCISAGAEISGYFLSKYHYNNSWIYNIYLVVSVSVLIKAGAFLSNKKIIKKLANVVVPLFILMWGISISRSTDKLASDAFLVGAILLCLLFLSILIENALIATFSYFKQPVVWLSIAIVIYFGCNIPYFGLMNHLIKDDGRLAYKLYDINLCLAIVYYLLLDCCFLLFTKRENG